MNLNVNVKPRPLVKHITETFVNGGCSPPTNGNTAVAVYAESLGDDKNLLYSLNGFSFDPMGDPAEPMFNLTANPGTRLVIRLITDDEAPQCTTDFMIDVGLVDPTRHVVVDHENYIQDPQCNGLNDGSVVVAERAFYYAHVMSDDFRYDKEPALQFRLVPEQGDPTAYVDVDPETRQAPFNDLPAGSYGVQVRLADESCEDIARMVLPGPTLIVLNNETTIEFDLTNLGGTITAGTITRGDQPYTMAFYDESDNLLTDPPIGSIGEGESRNFGSFLPSGTYTVIITDDDGCIRSKQTLIARLGDQGRSETAFYRLYPNPTRGQVTVEFDAPAGAGQIFEAHDLAGRLIGQWNLDEGARSLQIETTGWAEGLYACTLRHGKRTLFVSKLSVIR